MAQGLKPLLTIAIPTYNRFSLLDRALQSLFSQILNKDYSIEIIVSDNCSTDDTNLVVKKYIENGLNINYIVNNENKGPDFNILQCYLLAKGDYVLVFGDDDLFNSFAIEGIIKILKDYKEFGILHLSWKLKDQPDNLKKNNAFLLYYDYIDFFKKISHNITFISGNIVNAKYIKCLDHTTYLNSNLVQLSILLPAAFNSKYNIFHKRPLVSVEPENSGGFSVCKVFGENLRKVFFDISNDSSQRKVGRHIQRKLLLECFPSWIYRIKTKKNTFTDNFNLHEILRPVFKRFYTYWLLVYPLIVMSPQMMIIGWPLYKLYNACFRKFLLLFQFSKGNILKIKY